jgi:outer membrane protein TolC
MSFLSSPLFRLGFLSLMLWVFGYPPEVSAQNQNATSNFSLQQCLDYALNNNATLQNAKLDQEIAKEKVKEIFGSGLPQINFAGNLNYFIEFPTSVIPASAFIPSAPAGEYLAFQFGLPMNSTAGFNASQLLFNGEFLVGMQASKAYAELMGRTLKRTETEILLQVTKAYYLALTNEERIKTFNYNIERLEKLFSDTKAMHQQGFVEQLDLDRLTVSLNTLKIEKQKMEAYTTVGYQLLKFQMGMPISQTLILTDTDLEKNLKLESELDAPVGNRIELKLMDSQRRLNELELHRIRASYLPSLVAIAAADYQAYRADFGNIFFKPVTNRWYPQVLVGLQLNVPIFKGMSTHAKATQAQLNLKKTENDRAQVIRGIEVEVANARTQYANSLKNLSSQKENLKLAKEVARVTQLKYEQGVGSNLEVVTAESEYRSAQTQYVNTLFETLSAQVDLKKANGSLIPQP